MSLYVSYIYIYMTLRLELPNREIYRDTFNYMVGIPDTFMRKKLATNLFNSVVHPLIYWSKSVTTIQILPCLILFSLLVTKYLFIV
jgi:hypothetical protein